MTRFAFLARVAALAVAVAILADIVPVFAATTTIDLGDIYSGFASTIQTVIVAVILLGLGWLGYLLHVKFGIDIDLSHNQIAQTMATNLAGRLVALGQTKTQGKLVDVKSETMVNLVNEFKTALPSVMSRFGLTDDAIAKMIIGKIPQAMPPIVTTVAAANVAPAPAATASASGGVG